MKKLTYKKTILVCGGTGGIGSALIKNLDRSEWNMAITGQKNSTRLSHIMAELDIELGFEWDSKDRAGMKQIVEKIVSRYGSIDCLVNSIGVTYSKAFEDIDEKTTLDEYAINVLGTIYPIQECIPYFMRNEHGGKIVNISSLRGTSGLASTRSITYSMTKSAIVTLTSALAKQYSPKIQINAVAPGYTLTTMSNGWSDATWLNATDKNIYGRPAEPNEIANYIAFLISDKCSYMTGQTILIDGGYGIFDK
jgi:3-oxoacyl-[acyl-carrier protein] reductase